MRTVSTVSQGCVIHCVDYYHGQHRLLLWSAVTAPGAVSCCRVRCLVLSDHFLSCAFFSSVSFPAHFPKIDVCIQSMWAVTVVPLTPWDAETGVSETIQATRTSPLATRNEPRLVGPLADGAIITLMDIALTQYYADDHKSYIKPRILWRVSKREAQQQRRGGVHSEFIVSRGIAETEEQNEHMPLECVMQHAHPLQRSGAHNGDTAPTSSTWRGPTLEWATALPLHPLLLRARRERRRGEE